MLWGLYFGVILIIEKTILAKVLERLPRLFRHIYSIFLILVGWIIFRVENINNLIVVLKNLIIYKKSNLPVFLANNGDVLFIVPFFILCFICCLPFFKKIYERINNNKYGQYFVDIFLIGVFAITIIFLLAASYNPFIYFRF